MQATMDALAAACVRPEISIKPVGQLEHLLAPAPKRSPPTMGPTPQGAMEGVGVGVDQSRYRRPTQPTSSGRDISGPNPARRG
jgi:hypothetical protein